MSFFCTRSSVISEITDIIKDCGFTPRRPVSTPGPAGRSRLGTHATRLAALVPLIAALVLGRGLPRWVFMWLIALALFFGAKWITLVPLLRSKSSLSPARLIAYAFLWPGMDPVAFCGGRSVPRPALREWADAGIKSLFGAGLTWIAAPHLKAAHVLIAGWIGMIGLVLL